MVIHNNAIIYVRDLARSLMSRWRKSNLPYVQFTDFTRPTLVRTIEKRFVAHEILFVQHKRTERSVRRWDHGSHEGERTL